VVSYTFVAIFLALIGYIVYFNTRLSDEFQNSPYNKRQESYEEQVVRGDITAAGGEVLAETQVDEEGNETRVYPYSNLFAHVVGYTSKGRSGLESTENYHLLTSHAGAVEQVQHELQNEKNMGDTIVTTLDVELQQAAYDALGSYNGAVVVMEPDTGKILAMVSKPDFDPNTLDEIWDALVSDESNTNLLNRATQGLYPPGSTFKIVTTLAYLRSGADLNDFYFECQGEVTNGGYTIHCYNNNVHGSEDFATAFAKSCNSAFAQLGVDLNRSLFRSTAEDLLFNKDLPITLPYSKGKFSLDRDTPDALAMQTAIGQGNTVTSPFHMALITCAAANGGNLMHPYLVDRIENYNGDQVKKYTPYVYDELMSSQEAAVITELMEGVVENGTASRLSGKNYTAAGKTGTAEHGDMTGSPHAWFVGFSNVDNPDIAVSVIAESAGTGSDVAVPIAEQIFDAYYN
jgi:peptidoglycan glycosyltransferase